MSACMYRKQDFFLLALQIARSVTNGFQIQPNLCDTKVGRWEKKKCIHEKKAKI